MESVYTPILATKLHIPSPRPKAVLRRRLIERLNEGLQREHRATLISASAGFGKTALAGEWIAACGRPAAWLSLDKGDNDLPRFLIYLAAALQTIGTHVGTEVLKTLQAQQSQSLATEALLTTLLNQIATLPEPFVLVLDDYHVIDAQPVDEALGFLLDHLPPQMHLVIATREDPELPLARLRAGDRLTELRTADLRFTLPEAAEFLNQIMGLGLSAEDVAALENRTEGWIAGLQLAALSMQGRQDAGLVQSFTGSHRFVLDYLVAEILQHQPASVQAFLLHTSILDRLCGPLCDAVLRDGTASGQATLEYLERANLFVVPLDDERRWYRYHHLFGELLRQRLPQSIAASPEDTERRVNELHLRASQWYEDNALDIEAFHHAAAAHDVERAERLIESKGIPLHFRGAVIAILDWLASLPKTVLDARPSLWWRYASLLLMNGHTTSVEEKLQAAEAALQAAAPERSTGARQDDQTRNLIGEIAGSRAVLALTRYRGDVMLAQSRRALEYLHPNNLPSRARASWTMGYGHLFQGDRAASREAMTEAIALSRASKNTFFTITATIGLGNVQELENQLHQAADSYRHVLELAGDQPLQVMYEARLGLARICYEWNDLEAAEQHGQQSLQLAQQYESVIDRYIVCEVFLARLKLARGDVAGAAAILAEAGESARRRNFVHRIPEVAAAQVLVLLRQGNLAAAAQLVQAHKLPAGQARLLLAQGDAPAAMALLEPLRRQMEARGWQDELLKLTVLQALAHHAHGEKGKAMQLLSGALALAAPGGFIRLFVDEGAPMAQLLSAAAARGTMPEYTARLLAAFEAGEPQHAARPERPAAGRLVEPLSPRELEVLRLMAQGFSNREIGERLYLALSTVKGHVRIILGKLQVERRTAAIARARELGLI